MSKVKPAERFINNVQVFYVEGISNPRLEVGDLKAVVAFSQQNKLTSVVDATFTPPVNFKPASIGFDVVLHSATKYANGHSDILGGIAASSSSIIAAVLPSSKDLLKFELKSEYPLLLSAYETFCSM